MKYSMSRSLHSVLTLVVADQILQGVEGDTWGNIETAIIQRTDLIMFHSVPCLVAVSDRQRVAS